MSKNQSSNGQVLDSAETIMQTTGSSKEPALSLESARSILITEQPYYAYMLQACRFSWNDQVKTAGVRVNGVGQVELIISPKFWNALAGYTGVGLLMHEMLHILKEHLHRGKELNHRIANMAMDITINQFIPPHWLPKGALMPEMIQPDTISQQVKMPDGSIATIEMPNPKAGQVIWSFEKGKSFEIYYGELMKLREKQKEEMDKQDTMDNHDLQSEGMEGEGDGESSEGPQGDQESAGSGKDKDGKDKKPGSGDSKDVSKDVQKMAYDALINKATDEYRSNKAGNLPMHIQQDIMERFKPAVVNWKRELKKVVGRAISRHIESTRTRMNRRLGIYAPGYKKTYTARIKIGTDISGSVRDEWFVAFMSEVKEMVKGFDDAVELFFFDAEVCELKMKITEMKTMPRRPGAGGTVFNSAIKYANEKPVDLLIIFTDGDAPAPSIKSKAQVMWCVIGDYTDGKHLEKTGKLIKLDSKELLKKNK
jgi:predicted metal-dependent peptidase